MTSHTDGVAVHSLDSDLIDEPEPANTETHTHTHRKSSVRTSQRPDHHHAGWIGRLRSGSDIGRQWANLMTKNSKNEISPFNYPALSATPHKWGPKKIITVQPLLKGGSYSITAPWSKLLL